MIGYEIISDFLDKTSGDGRISNAHIGLFAILVHMFSKQDYEGPLSVFARNVMEAAKISSSATYHKLIKELNEYGYLQYRPSYNRRVGSKIFINGIVSNGYDLIAG